MDVARCVVAVVPAIFLAWVFWRLGRIPHRTWGELGADLPKPSRPVPPMPECRPPMPEHQVLNVKAGDAIVITSDRLVSKEQRDRLVEYAKKAVPDGVKVLVIDGGMKISTLRSTDGLLAESKRTNELLQQLVEQGSRNEFVARMVHE